MERWIPFCFGDATSGDVIESGTRKPRPSFLAHLVDMGESRPLADSYHLEDKVVNEKAIMIAGSGSFKYVSAVATELLGNSRYPRMWTSMCKSEKAGKGEKHEKKLRSIVPDMQRLNFSRSYREDSHWAPHVTAKIVSTTMRRT